MEHETSEMFTREVETTLPLPTRPRSRSRFHFGFSSSQTRGFVCDWVSLPTNVVESDTGWQVRFWICDDGFVSVSLRFIRYENDNEVGVIVRCVYRQYPTTVVRLLATTVGDPQNWVEIADILPIQSKWSWFRKRFELGRSAQQQQVRIRVRWTELQLLPRAIRHIMNEPAWVRCRWQLCNFNTVHPTAAWWRLWSEQFGSGALWRMWVINRINSRSSRTKLWVGVDLQYVTEELQELERLQGLQWSCTLTYSNTQFTRNDSSMIQGSDYMWKVADVEGLLADTLDLQLLICITQREWFICILCDSCR